MASAREHLVVPIFATRGGAGCKPAGIIVSGHIVSFVVVGQASPGPGGDDIAPMGVTLDADLLR
jgi:hypothetical protein